MSKKASTKSESEELRYHIISKYRGLISTRYDEIIKNIDKTHINIGRDVATELKEFFLDNVYPEPAQRRKLDASFAELKKFTTDPTLIWGVLGSLPMALFHFGTQLPQAIKAGATSLQAYTSAIGYEEAMLKAALNKGFKVPLSDDQFFECLRSIPHKGLMEFINEASSLITVASDTTLLSKTMNIMEDVRKRMKAKSELYTASQVEAIELGLDLMRKGYELLEPYTEDTKREIIAFITESERKFIAEVYGK